MSGSKTICAAKQVQRCNERKWPPCRLGEAEARLISRKRGIIRTTKKREMFWREQGCGWGPLRPERKMAGKKIGEGDKAAPKAGLGPG